MANFDIDSQTALLKLKPEAAQLAIQNSSAPFFLVTGYSFIIRGQQIQRSSNRHTVYTQSSIWRWTTNFQRPLAAKAPVALLKQRLHQFYGREMET